MSTQRQLERSLDDDLRRAAAAASQNRAGHGQGLLYSFGRGVDGELAESREYRAGGQNFGAAGCAKGGEDSSSEGGAGKSVKFEADQGEQRLEKKRAVVVCPGRGTYTKTEL